MCVRVCLFRLVVDGDGVSFVPTIFFVRFLFVCFCYMFALVAMRFVKI